MSQAASPGYVIHLPTPVAERLQQRAARAGLFDRAGRPDVAALQQRALEALGIAEPGNGHDAMRTLLNDRHDPDLAAYLRASIEASVRRHPQRWPAHLADRLDLDTATLFRLHRRAELEAVPGHPAADLASMASAAAALAFNGTAPSEAALSTWMNSHRESGMRKLFVALERARAAARPN